MELTEQYHQWHIITYAKEEEFKPLIDYVRHYAYIFHDKEECEPHYHILISGLKISPSAIKKRINSTQNTRFEKMLDKHASFVYLTHDNDKDKYQYDKSSIKCDSLDFWQVQQSETKEEKNEEFLNDLLCLSKYQLAVKYGRDFMRHFKTYMEFAQIVSNEMFKEKDKIYILGGNKNECSNCL